MTPNPHFALLAHYHLWATRRLFEHVQALTEADYRRDAGLFFGSVHGTLNHLLVADRLWFARFARNESPRIALDAELETDRTLLRAALLESAAGWGGFVERCAAERWDGQLHYQRVNGEAMTLPFAAAMAHVFNHGTHHRGQISAALTAMGHACPELDLVWMLVQQQREGAT